MNDSTTLPPHARDALRPARNAALRCTHLSIRKEVQIGILARVPWCGAMLSSKIAPMSAEEIGRLKGNASIRAKSSLEMAPSETVDAWTLLLGRVGASQDGRGKSAREVRMAQS
jgi:hypothetical protein